jgi:diguanylate cyclase (GGDEF)-like protein
MTAQPAYAFAPKSSVPLRILLVDDSASDAALVEQYICESMTSVYHIERVAHLSGAIKRLADAVFDIIILSDSLPDTAGFNALHTVQAAAPHLPIVMLSDNGEEECAFNAIAEGAQDYLFKPSLTAQSVNRAVKYALLRKQHEHSLIRRAHYDMLTGLANRTLFENRLQLAYEKMRRHGGHIAVLFIDLDGFKLINDTLGHQAGDEVLKQLAYNIETCLRPYDTAARFGGDEFAVLIDDSKTDENAEIVAQKLLNICDMPLDVNGRQVNIGMSIGITTADDVDDVSIDMLLKQADDAMYTAKAEAGSCFKRYEPLIMDEGLLAQS